MHITLLSELIPVTKLIRNDRVGLMISPSCTSFPASTGQFHIRPPLLTAEIITTAVPSHIDRARSSVEVR